ncbi:hypothetical protein [Kosakonia sp. MUSA4]|uniref:hypothetical protein n=1 Tax=Kosakonia sp. MUSA4 TaxID=2067958 RepID=UPI00159B0235|nr:hypothetical protein [Kosakonia sp. MUSA4]QJT80715.1 hypothetical protein C0557_11830 [Kosakonia sp. MUSA4]
MTFPGQLAGNNLPDYGLARSLGLAPGDDFDFTSLANQLDCTRSFHQVGIIYSDGPRQWLVRPSRRIATPNQSTVSHVIVTKVNSQSTYSAAQAINTTIQAPSLTNEITSTAISCGAAVVTGVLALGAGAAVPLTAGASGVVAAIITAGTVATVAQCAIGLGRISLIATNNDEVVTWLDSESWYVTTSTALDILSLAGAGAGLKSTLETYKLMKGATSSSVTNWLKNLSRAERKRITEEIIRAQNPGISNTGVKAAMKAGFYPKRYPSEALQTALQRELTAALVNTSAFAGSALTGTIRNPGNMKTSGQYIIGLIQSFSFTGSNG